jgi:hypothetical protein
MLAGKVVLKIIIFCSKGEEKSRNFKYGAITVFFFKDPT